MTTNRKYLLPALSIFMFCLYFAPSLQAQEKKDKKDDLIITATPSNYEEITSRGIVFVDYWAIWCGPCRKMNPILEDVAKERKGIVTIAKLNTDEHKKFSRQQKISSIPTIIIYKDGKELARSKGVVSKEKLIDIVDYLSSPEAEE